MKKLFTIVTVAGAVLALAAGAYAQGAGPKGGAQGQTGKQGQVGGKRQGRGGMMMMRNPKAQEEMFAKLGLSADQKKKIEALQKSTSDKMKALGFGGKRTQWDPLESTCRHASLSIL